MLLTEVENHAMERHNFIAELMIENCDKKGKKKKRSVYTHILTFNRAHSITRATNQTSS